MKTLIYVVAPRVNPKLTDWHMHLLQLVGVKREKSDERYVQYETAE